MHDEQPKKKPLSEIGHLFLSSVRERQLNGLPLPQRTPPGGTPAPRSDVSLDLTPEEYAQVFGEGADEAVVARRTPPVTAIIGEHLNGKQLSRVKDYARHLATAGGRIGLIELDGSEFRLMCFEPGESNPTEAATAETATDCYDPRAMAEAIEELNFDVDRWLLLIPSPRVPEAQPLLKLVDHWVLLTTCDHDGVVSSYRMLKALADLHTPRLSLAVLDAIDVAQADKVYKKLSGVCQQFLDRTLEAESPVRREYRVCEHVVMLCRPTRDKAQLANPPQWDIVSEFLAKAKAPAPVVDGSVPRGTNSLENAPRELVADMVVSEATESFGTPAVEVMAAAEFAAPVTVEVAQPAVSAVVAGVAPAAVETKSTSFDGLAEIVDLPSSDATAEQIVGAVLRHDTSSMLECPVRPPMCLDARLAVTRDRSFVLLAVAKRGLAELNAIGQAYRWLIENRSLIGMAVPQLSIDPAQPPRLRLLVDQCDAGAEVLQPMLTGDHVAVQSYRRVKWGSKAGLLLEAA